MHLFNGGREVGMREIHYRTDFERGKGSWNRAT
jgi:hypothetical protein